jgi:hypothetical protein
MGRTYSDKVTAGTPMKGSHVRILRGYIEQDLNAASVPFNWTWSNWSANQDAGTPVRAIYFKEMRDAIQALWDSKGRGDLPGWTQETPQGTSTGHSTPAPIRATHVTDLRLWLNQYEDNHPPLTQGINSLSYYPFSNNKPVIYDVDPNDWTSDVKSLSSRRLLVRTSITGRQSGSNGNYTVSYTSTDYDRFKSAFHQYKNQNIELFPVFEHLFHKPSDDYTSESYRVEFANKLLEFLEQMYSDDIHFGGILIWNEPNNNPDPNNPVDFLTAEQFSRLLYRCWKTLSTSSTFEGNVPRIYWGGIFSSNDGAYTDAVEYVSSIYSFFNQSGLMNSEAVPFPWSGINIHMNSIRSNTHGHNFIKAVKDKQISSGDWGELVIGEWGVTLDDGPDELSDLYVAITQSTFPLSQRVLPDIMFYYTHHVVTDSNGKWGLRWSGEQFINSRWRFTVNPYLTPVPDDMKALALRNRYVSIMN